MASVYVECVYDLLLCRYSGVCKITKCPTCILAAMVSMAPLLNLRDTLVSSVTAWTAAITSTSSLELSASRTAWWTLALSPRTGAHAARQLKMSHSRSWTLYGSIISKISVSESTFCKLHEKVGNSSNGYISAFSASNMLKFFALRPTIKSIYVIQFWPHPNRVTTHDHPL